MAQRRIKPLPAGHVVEGPTPLPPGISEVLGFGQIESASSIVRISLPAGPSSLGRPTHAKRLCECSAVSVSTQAVAASRCIAVAGGLIGKGPPCTLASRVRRGYSGARSGHPHCHPKRGY